MERKGEAQRGQFGRSDLAKPAKRKFDPIKVLREAAKGRIPKLMPAKFRLMSGSPFVFYRGSVEIMAADLAAGKNTGIIAQLCGDAHVKNFGFYATPGADIVLDVNDFDETWRGPWEWDVKRMAASIVLAAREAGETEVRCKDAALIFASDYCRWIRHFAVIPTLEIARHRITRNSRDPLIRMALEKAERSTPLSKVCRATRKNRVAYWRCSLATGQAGSNGSRHGVRECHRTISRKLCSLACGASSAQLRSSTREKKCRRAHCPQYEIAIIKGNLAAAIMIATSSTSVI